MLTKKNEEIAAFPENDRIFTDAEHNELEAIDMKFIRIMGSDKFDYFITGRCWTPPSWHTFNKEDDQYEFTPELNEMRSKRTYLEDKAQQSFVFRGLRNQEGELRKQEEELKKKILELQQNIETLGLAKSL